MKLSSKVKVSSTPFLFRSWGSGVLAMAAVMFPVYAQEPSDEQEDVRDVLAPKPEDLGVNQWLEDVFNQTERKYSLVKRGAAEWVYDVDYSYYGDEHLDQDLRGEFTLGDLTQDSEHRFDHVLSMDYGILDNVSLGIRLPLVMKYDDVNDNDEINIGDIQLRLRWQPWATRAGETQWTMLASATFPTGESPFETDFGEELSTGSGYGSFSLGASAFRVMDPAALFANAQYTFNFEEDSLSQSRGFIPAVDPVSGRPVYRPLTMEGIDPGDTLSFALGFAYAISYELSMTLQYQYSYFFASDLQFSGMEGIETVEQTSGLMALTVGWRRSRGQLINVTAGFGTTDNSPDMYLGLSLPLGEISWNAFSNIPQRPSIPQWISTFSLRDLMPKDKLPEDKLPEDKLPEDKLPEDKLEEQTIP